MPSVTLWDQPLAASRLMEYEIRQRLALMVPTADPTFPDPVFARVAFVELIHDVVSRALLPFPGRVRTLDALHLATADFLRAQGAPVQVATYDVRMERAARAMGFDIFDLDA